MKGRRVVTGMGYAEEGEVTGVVESLPFLDESACDALCRQVHRLRSHWVQRLEGLPMYSLGAVAYLDAAAGEADYLAAAARDNPILLEHFGWLYRRLEEALDQRLAGPVAYPAGKALPGFHVFLAHPFFTFMEPSIHADLQYQRTDWSWARNISRPFTFTVALALPHEGGGLNVWDVSGRQLDALPSAQRSRALHAAKKQFVAYRRGHLSLQFGHQMHQIATPKTLVDGDQRVTFQGHGLLCDGVWQLYW
jgi:hypothetical protein